MTSSPALSSPKARWRGPKLYPWGTPCLSWSASEVPPLIVMRCLQPDKCDVDKFSRSSFSKHWSCRWSKIWWSTVSKALDRSINKPTVNLPSSIAVEIMSYNWTKACRVEWCFTIQYNTIQYNTIQYNTIQYNTIVYWHSPGGAFQWQCD